MHKLPVISQRNKKTKLIDFGSFLEHYLYHFPILDLQKPIDSIHNDSPVLFWTVIIISAQKHPLHSEQFKRLLTPFKMLFSSYLLNSICSFYTIQALLLLCIWPFPVNKQREDPSWEYCGMAVAAILKLAPDDPQRMWPSSTEASAETVTAGLKTWLGCFFVTTK